MNFIVSKKTKPQQFSLKSIDNSNLFQRRIFHIDNQDPPPMLSNYKLNHVAGDKNDKITNTPTMKNADNSPSNGANHKIIICGNEGDMESVMAKAAKIEVNPGLVDVLFL